MKIPIKFNKIGAGVSGGVIDEANMPLTFKATAPSTVKLNAKKSPTVSGLQYRLGKSGGWSPYVIGTEISLDTNKQVQFQNTETTLSKGSTSYVNFVMTGTIEAYGNIQSMLNYSETLKSYCYARMFSECTSLTKAPELPATTLTKNCYDQMFYNCTSLTKAPELPATTLANYCYSNMFTGCKSLTEIPEILPATTLVDYCYDGMFSECTSLTKAPELPATTLKSYCYARMFFGCTSLTKAPELPATTLVAGCYKSMFQGCKKLENVPEILPATTLTDYCYSDMFSGCFNLTKAPELPATTLATGCYDGMFCNCISLTEAPELPATTLANYCYGEMFYGCTKLSSIKVGFTEWNTQNTGSWVYKVAYNGTFIKLTALPEEFGGDKIPTGWTVVNSDATVIDPEIYELEITGTSYGADGTYTLYDTSATEYNRIWVLSDGSHCIRYTSGFWVLCTKIGSSVENESDWIVLNSISDGENPWDNQLHNTIVCSKK